MRLVQVCKVKAPPRQQSADFGGRPRSQAQRSHTMDGNLRFPAARGQRRITCRYEFHLDFALAQAEQRQQCLALAAAPFALEVYVEHPHGVCMALPRCSAATSFPSFLNFSRTLRAAIREMSHPRYPSRKPPRKIKVLKQVHGAANHIAARQLLFPASYIWRAASVV